MNTTDTDSKLGSWIRRFKAGETVFSEGETSNTLYILLDGKVEILHAGGRISEVSSEEAFIGEIAALTGQPRSATVRTLSDCSMMVVKDVAELLALDTSWSLKLARILATRLRRVEIELAALREHAAGLKDDDTIRLVAGLVNCLTTALKPGEADQTVNL